MATGRSDDVITLIPSTWRHGAHSVSSSTRTTTGNTVLYGDDFLEDLRRRKDFSGQCDNEVLVPSSQPLSPSSTRRIDHMVELLQAALKQSPQSVPGMLDIGCVRYSPVRTRAKLESDSCILRLADDDEQWERWVAGDEEVPPGLTQTETSAILLQRVGGTAVRLSHPAPDNQAPPAKRRKLGEAKIASQLKFPAVKRLSNPHDKALREKGAPVTPSDEARVGVSAVVSEQQSRYAIAANATPAISPVPSPPRELGNISQVMSSQEPSLHVDPHPIPPGPALHTSFDPDSSISFEPPMTSTPTRGADLEPRSRACSGTGDPFTPMRSKAANYVANMATPISECDAPLLDRRALRRVPTLEQLIRAESTAKKRERHVVVGKRQNFESLAALHSDHAQLEPLDEFTTPTKAATRPPTSGMVTSEGTETHKMNDAPESTTPAGATPVHTAPNSQEELTPTASAVKRRTLGSVISFGSMGFSSQYDVESKIDDISRFMKDDVDDVFL